MFANAGGGEFGGLDELTPEGFDRTFEINVRGTAFTVQKALPLLNDQASIVVTGSSSTRHSAPGSGLRAPDSGVYSASKAALAGVARLRAEDPRSTADPGSRRASSAIPGPFRTM